MKDVYTDLNGQLNQLIDWKFQITTTDLWASEARFYYNSSDDRLVIGRTSWDGRVAYLDDLFGLNKWKYDVVLATNTWENLALSGSATIDGVATTNWDKVLVKNQTDQTENGIYIVDHGGAWTRSADSDIAEEIEWAMIIVEWGTPIDSGGNKWTLRRNLNWDWTVTLWTTNIIYWQISLSVPFEDRFVKVSDTDTTEKYLKDTFNHAFVTTWPAINNQDIIKIIHLDVWSNETIALGVDLSNYTGDLWITGDLIVDGQTTLNDLNFAWPDNTVDWTNTTQTGTTTYDNSYDATYEGSTINHEWSTTNYDETSVTNQGGTTNYTETSVTTWDQNYDENYTANYEWSTINYGYVPVLIWCSGSQTVSIGTPYTEAIDTNAEYAEVLVVYDQWGTDERTTSVRLDETTTPITVTDPWATLDGEITLEWDSGNITATKVSGSEDFVVDVCQRDADAAWAGTTINNEWTTENYTGENTINYDGTLNQNYADTYEENNVYTAWATINNTGEVTENNTDMTTNENNTNVVNNVDGDITNNYDATYEENNSYTAGSTINNEGEVTQNYNNYTEENVYDDNSQVTNTNMNITYTTEDTLLICSGTQALPLSSATDPDATKIVVTVSYDSLEDTITLDADTLTDSVTITDGTFTATWDNVANTIDVTQDAGALVGTVDVCEYKAGTSDIYYDEGTTTINEGDVYNESLTVNNISYQENYVAGEALTDRQPLRMGVAALWEDEAKVYGANSTDADHSGFIGFASKDVLVDEALVVLQWPRVSGLEAVYGPLVDASTYYLQDDGTIGLVPWTISVRLGDASGTDTLVGLNTPIPEAAKVPPKQLMATNAPIPWYVAVAVDEDNFERQEQSGGWSGLPFIEEHVTTAGQTTITLANTPSSPEAVWLSSDSWLYSKQGATRDYTVSGNVITLNTPALAWDVITVQGFVNNPSVAPARTIVNTGTTYTAQDQEYIVVTSGSDLEITLPTPSATAKVQVKKLTGEDTSEITILPNGAELIDWFTWATMNIDRSMVTLTSVDGNRYIGD